MRNVYNLILLVLGIVLLVFAFNGIYKTPDQVSEAVTGRYTNTTMWYLLGGVALSLIGGIGYFRKRG